MNEFITIEHDYSAPYVEAHSYSSKKQNLIRKEKGDKQHCTRNKMLFEINPKWRTAYAGW